MKYALASLVFVSQATDSFAGVVVVRVPEIEGLAGMAALGLVGAVVAFIWERRSKQRPH